MIDLDLSMGMKNQDLQFYNRHIQELEFYKCCIVCDIRLNYH